MTSRRTALGVLGAGVAMPRLVLAQSPKQAAVVVLYAGESEEDEPGTRPFFDELRRLGWVEGHNIAYERLSGRGMRGYAENLARSAAERNPDVIYATTATIALAALKATGTIPVVFTAASDPVASGLVASLFRPGRNATGAFQVTGEVVQKRFELLREAFPGEKRVGGLFDRAAANYRQQRDAHESAARGVGIDMAVAEFTNYEAVAKILASFRRDRIAVVAVAPSFTLLPRRKDVSAFALRNGLSLVAHRVEWAEAGALMTYGAEIAEVLRRSAAIAARILKGAKPAEIPVEKATNLELSINRRTAKSLGVMLPKSLLQRANRVID